METLIIIIALCLSCGIVLITIPPIVRVARAKNIFDVADYRKVHLKSIPTLGGISLFMAINITTAILSVGYPAPSSFILYAAMIMLFFTGIKDDILFIAPKTKFLIQFLAALLLVRLGNYVITDFQGILGIYEAPTFVAQSFTVLLIMFFINAYNLIDGIDGLTGMLSILASIFFSIWFFLNGLMLMAIFSTAIIGSLLGFLRFNLYCKDYKIFMGDTGSLLIGLLMAIQVIWFLNINLVSGIPYPVAGAPVIALALVAIPLIDTLRVFSLRVLKGKSPFHPDKTHIHHHMLKLLPKHIHSSLCITGLNLLILLSAILLIYSGLNINLQFLIIFSMSTVISFLPGIMTSSIGLKESIVVNINGRIEEDPNTSRLRREIRKHKTTIIHAPKTIENESDEVAV